MGDVSVAEFDSVVIGTVKATIASDINRLLLGASVSGGAISAEAVSFGASVLPQGELVVAVVGTAALRVVVRR